MTEKNVRDALIHVLGIEVIKVFEQTTYPSLPQMLSVAALKVFRENWAANKPAGTATSGHLDCIRSALNMLESPGYFTFTK